MSVTEKIVAFVFVAGALAVYVLEVLLVVIFAARKLRARKAPDIFWSKPAVIIHALAAIGIICFLYACLVEPYWLEVKTIRIPTEKLSRARFRLVHISDLHCDKKLRIEKKLVERINQIQPDVIVFTGDTLRLKTPSALPVFKNTMSDLKAGLAKFAVRGNVDVWYLPNLDFYGGTGFEVLDANIVELQKDGETFYISGLNCEYPSAVRSLLQSVPADRFSIFLYHYPDLIEEVRGLNVDLYLAGHTHGGQIALPGYGALITLSKFGKEYESGMYHVGSTILYVNRGIGGHASRVRFFARPEITVFDVGPNQNGDD